MKRVLAVLALALCTGCAKPKPVSPPPPPRIQQKVYPKPTPRPGDMAIYGCTVVEEIGNRADCLCRKASTKIDAQDASKQSIVCK